ncbi:hypothetical protein EYZ11_011636 [Aspergillus tanneri]|uniref:Uncharacterized protein n=1 Tax=Aspergillus tanneri TaxID=1220188 RepID=A0A4S3J4H2_9EURO|nr:hypothetical protein EYZ11_011636 [Aspergillus tanneri]
MMLGYIDDAERTRDAFDDDGYFKTGDLAHRDRDGTYVIDGRASADCRFTRHKACFLPRTFVGWFTNN